VTIGVYAVVGAGSVVTKDVLPFGLVYGNPAELKGFVCYCGRKLREIVREEREKIVYRCECGKEVETTRLHKINTEERKWG
jgi:acyl-[acyl carrier protein]--UDP-N-acetylglucosamine O-acyltransferase